MAAAPAPFPLVPTPLFGMVLGIAGLGGAWRTASRVWGYPAAIGETLLLIAAILWAVWLALYVGKWMKAAAAARTELADPVASFALGLIPMATLMTSAALQRAAPDVAWWLLVLGLVGGGYLAARLMGDVWQGGRGLETITPLCVLPSVGVAFTGAIAAAGLGHTEVAAILWGTGLFVWIALDSAILLRLLQHPLPVPLRASIGIQLAPPTVGCLAYLAFTPGPPDKLVHFLIGYAILQAIILLRLNAWIREQPFSPGAWAFTFGVAAFAGSTLICLERAPASALAALAWPAFLFANVFIAWIAIRTGQLALQGKLFLKPAPK